MLKARVTPSPVPSTKPKPQVEEPALELEDDYDDDFDSHATPTASRGSAMNIQDSQPVERNKSKILSKPFGMKRKA